MDKKLNGSVFNDTFDFGYNDEIVEVYSSSDLGVTLSFKPEFVRFSPSGYKVRYSKQVIKTSELDTVGSSSISEDINRMLARGELDKFLRETSLQTFRSNMQGDLSSEDVSILNVKHADLYDLNTYYNKLIVAARKTYNSILEQQVSGQAGQTAQAGQANSGADTHTSATVGGIKQD